MLRHPSGNRVNVFLAADGTDSELQRNLIFELAPAQPAPFGGARLTLASVLERPSQTAQFPGDLLAPGVRLADFDSRPDNPGGSGRTGC
jgi:hypothetical protein